MNQSIERSDFTSVTEAMKVIRTALLENCLPGSYYHSWQANIAMSFYDEYKRQEEWKDNKLLEGQTATEIDLSELANNAAKNFLNLLIVDSTSLKPLTTAPETIYKGAVILETHGYFICISQKFETLHEAKDYIDNMLTYKP